MRESARVSQGFFPTQDRIVHAVARLFKLPDQHNGPLTVHDAGCGTGQAIHDLREIWLTQRPDLSVTLLDIESDNEILKISLSALALRARPDTLSSQLRVLLITDLIGGRKSKNGKRRLAGNRLRT